jgi:DNA-directed RNA polymerase specialized sigma24 family protein
MFFSRNRRSTRQVANEYATRSDFQNIFSEDMAGLHLLAYLLTADHGRAEEVFVAGLEDTINGNPVFRQWARSWSQRAIIKRAIKAIAPSPEEDHIVSGPMHQTGRQELDSLVRVTSQLNTFQRFVFVLSILEGYSNMECAALLACRVADVISAKAFSLQKVSAAAQREPAIADHSVDSLRSLFRVAQAG